MRIGGFQKTDLVNYPGMVASTIFCCGCNFRCPYCHNPEFVVERSESARPGETYSEKGVLDYLSLRSALIDGLVVSGGEPTLQGDLPDFMKKVKGLGLKTKLDTNGSRPQVIHHLIDQNLVDYIAMDVKAPLDKYGLFGFDDVKRVDESIKMIKGSKIDHEFRTTCLKEILSEGDFAMMADMIGESRWYLQTFNPTKTLDPCCGQASSYSREELAEMAKTLGSGQIRVR